MPRTSRALRRIADLRLALVLARFLGVLALGVALIAPNPVTQAQVGSGGTLTVLRGSVAVLRGDGTALGSAASGLSLTTGDQVSTLPGAGALVTFFEGSEIELGAETSIIIQEASSAGAQTHITVESIVGSTIHRVVTLTDSGSTYRVEAGNSVGLVRGTIFGHHVDPAGDVTVALQSCGRHESPDRNPRECLEFPSAGQFMREGSKRTSSARGDIVTENFALGSSLFNAITVPALGNPSLGTENPGFATGSRTVAEQQSILGRSVVVDREVTAEPTLHVGPGLTFLTAPVAAGSTILPVPSSAGFSIGDTIRINPGGSPTEDHVIIGFGSILLDPLDPVQNNYPAGTTLALVRFALTPTATLQASPTVSVSPTASSTSTALTISTATVTLTPSSVATVVSSPTSTTTSAPTRTANAISTSTLTLTPTGTTTPTIISSSTPTSTASVTATLTSTSTLTPTVTITPTATATTAPVPCDVQTQSGAEAVTTTIYNLHQTGGTFRFVWQAFTIPDQFEIDYEGDQIFDTHLVSGDGSVLISYGPGSATRATVRVTRGGTASQWQYTVYCPN